MRRLALAAALAMITGSARAEPGRTAAAFLQRPLGAMAAGMGGAFVAVRHRAESMQYNAANLASVSRPTLTSTYLNGFGGTNHGFVGYTHPIGKGALSASVLYFNAGSIDLNLSNGTTGRVTSEEDSAWMLSYSHALTDSIRIGATYRYVRMNLAETAQATTSQGDFGAAVDLPIPGVSLGVAYQNWGPDITFEQAGDPPPKTLRYGLALHFPDIDISKIDPNARPEKFDMILAADGVNVLREEPVGRVGIEMGIKPTWMSRVALRFGWVFNASSESITFGLGFRHGKFGLDYAVGTADVLGSLQQFSLAFYF